MGKYDGVKLGTFICKMILQKYASLWIYLSDVLVFTAYLGMAEIFTDFATGSKQNSRKCQELHATCLLPFGKFVTRIYP